MALITQIAKHVREVHFGGNWTCSNLKDQLADVTWQEAVTNVCDLNTIAALTFHVNYYVDAALQVLQGKPLLAKDAYSYSHLPIESANDWQKLMDKAWSDAETFVKLIEQLPEEKLWEDFTDPKYGLYYRNLHGIVEHMHYHLGQIAVIKKILKSPQTGGR
jgi:hypothetical protein